MCLDLSWDVSVASAEVRMSLSLPKQSQRGCWRTLSPGPATAQHGNFDDEMKSAEAVKSWFDIFCENCEIDWHTNSIVENHIHHIRSRSFYCVKSQCLLRSRVYFISIPDAVIIEVQVGPRRTVHVQFASHTLHQFENQFECRMKWYEMIWNERNHRTHVSQDVPSLWCDTLWHSALRNVQAQGLDFTVLQIMVRMHWMRSWNRTICSSVWHEPFVNLLDRKSTKRIQERHSWHC